MRPHLFKSTREIVEEAERRIIGAKTAGKAWDPVRRRLLFPVRFLGRGLTGALRPSAWWTWVVFALLVLALYLYKGGISIELYIHGPTVIGLLLLILILVFFAVPSTFAFDTIGNIHVQSLADHIEEIGFKTEETIKLLEDSLRIVAERSALRTKSTLWSIGGAWAFYLYWLNQFHSAGLILEPEKIRSAFSENMFQLGAIGVGLVCCIFAVACHKRAVDITFRSLFFATNELKYRIAVNSAK